MRPTVHRHVMVRAAKARLMRVCAFVASAAFAGAPIAPMAGVHGVAERAEGARSDATQREVCSERLDNGLRVMIRPLPTGQDVCVALAFDIGEMHDPEGASGLAHLVEHLWVTAAAGSTPARTADRWMNEPGRRTAANAQTGERYTIIASVVPAKHLAEELRDHAARMHAVHITQADLDRERPRLRQELANMYGGATLLSALNNARQAAVPAPPGGQRGGVPDQVDGLSLERVRDRLRHYGASHATLAIAGPVSAPETLQLVRALFESAPSGEPLPTPRARGPLRLERVAHVERSAHAQVAPSDASPFAAMAFAAAQPTDDDYPAFVLAIAAMMTPADPTQRNVTPPVVFAPLDDPSTVTLVCHALQPGETDSAILEALRAPVVDVLGDPASALQRAKNGQIFGPLLGTVAMPDAAMAHNPYLAAFALARHAQLGMDGATLQRRMQAVTPSDLQRVVGARFAEDLGRAAIAGSAPQTLPQRVAAAALEGLAARAYFASRVDWAALRQRMRERVNSRATIEDARAFIGEAIAQLQDPHTRLELPPASARAPTRAPEPAPPSTPTPSSKPNPAPAQKSAPAPVHVDAPAVPRVVPSLPSAALLEGSIAYVQLPPCADASPDHVRAYADALHGAICAMLAATPAGWIVDLRLNGGGTMWPMIAGLHPLLGDGTYGGSLSRDGQATTYGVTAGAAWLEQGGARSTRFERTGPPCTAPASTAPVALLIGPWTMSSGEIVAASFAQRAGTRRFGEPTAGLATAVEPLPLEDGSTLQIATGVIVNAAGHVVPSALAPDDAVSWGDWPSQSDAAVRAATAWIAGKKEPSRHAEQESPR